MKFYTFTKIINTNKDINHIEQIEHILCAKLTVMAPGMPLSQGLCMAIAIPGRLFSSYLYGSPPHHHIQAFAQMSPS